MTMNFEASRQWVSRPADERYLDLPSMLAMSESVRERSAQNVVSSRTIKFRPADADPTRGRVVAVSLDSKGV